jgi:alpha-tubulin suppressor-like RCC1 family protein
MGLAFFRSGLVFRDQNTTSVFRRSLVCIAILLWGVVSSPRTSAQSSPLVFWGGNNNGQTNVPPDLTNVAAFACGATHNLVLRRDGTVVAWGAGTSGKTNVPAGLSNVIAVAGGESHSVALLTNGTIQAWGSGPMNPPAGLANVVGISAGNAHNLALRRDGSVVAWGDNSYGQTNVPPGLSNVVAVAGGYYHSLALKADGSVIGWGRNNYGQANGVGLSNVTAVAGGVQHSVALRRDGTVIVWGDAYYGQQSIPAGLSNVVSLASLQHFTVALRADGTVVAWGNNAQGQTAVPVGLTNVASVAAGLIHSGALIQHGPPFLLNGLVDRTIHAGGKTLFQCAVNGEGPLFYQWYHDGVALPAGTNAWLNLTNLQPAEAGLYSVTVSNHLGTAPRTAAQLTILPMLITAQPQSQVRYAGGTATFTLGLLATEPIRYQWRFNGVDLAGATNATLGLSNLLAEQGGLYLVVVSNAYGSITSAPAQLDVSFVAAWGQNQIGQTNVPAGLIAPRMVAGGTTHSLVLQGDGTVVAWGDNVNGQSSVPPGLTNVVAIAGGFEHSYAVRGDGTVVAWGNNSVGQTNLPLSWTNVIGIEAGYQYCLGLNADGTLVTWGVDYHGQFPVLGSLSNMVAISAGRSHSLAVRADGTVVACGYNFYGQTNVPPGLSNVVAVAAGDNLSLALRDNGTIVSWGVSAFVPAGSNFVAIASGNSLSMALRVDGTVVAWGGNNDYGERTIPAELAGVTHVAAGDYHSLAVIGNGPPSLLTPLPDRTIHATGTVFFRAAASGAGPLKYQWRFNGVNLPGQTNALLVITNAQLAQAGLYSVVVSNGLGTVTSREAQLCVPPLTFSVPPQSQSIFAGGSATFSVSLNGPSPVSYQWRFNGAVLPGATNAQLIMSDVHPDRIGWYSVTVSNSLGAVTSPAAWLDVKLVGGWGNNYYGQATPPAGLTNIVAIAAGEEHSLGLRRDGTVVGWGYNVSGQTNPPVGLSKVVAIAGAGYACLALRSDGTAVGWGTSYYGQTAVPVGLTNLVAIAGGDTHSLGLRVDGSVVAWGQGYFGQATVPLNASNVIAIASGAEHSLALRADGTVLAWGRSNYGQTSVPAGLSNVIAIAGGGNHSVALRADGSVVGWGDSPYGNRNFPSWWLSNAVAVADMDSYSVALRADGTPWAWGYYYAPYVYPVGPSNTVAIASGYGHVISLVGSGAPYLQSAQANRTALVGGAVYFPTAVTGARPMTYQWRRNGNPIAGATNATLALTNVLLADAGLYSLWVSNAWGTAIGAEAQLTVLPIVITTQPLSQNMRVEGTATLSVVAQQSGPFTYQWRHNGNALVGATNSTLVLSDVQIEQAGDYAVVVSNAFGSVTSAVAVVDVAMVVGWGINIYGETNTPAGLGRVISIASGDSHNLALRADGTLVAWGDNTYGQRNVPSGLSNVIGVAAAARYTLALRNDGTVVAWGSNNYGETDVPPSLTNAVAIACRWYFSVALRADGTVLAWGHESYTGVPAGLDRVVAIACGEAHTLALRADGTVVAWGDNGYGQSTVPPELTNVIAIAAGGVTSFAVCADGTVAVWGANNYGIASIPVGLDEVEALAIGYQHSLARRTDGSLAAWGQSTYGQGVVPAGLSNVVSIAAGRLHNLALLGSGPGVPLSVLVDRAAIAGKRVYFHAPAGGRRPLSHQWRYNDTDIVGATNALLMLDNVQPNQAGLYSVVMSNAFGAVTSRAAQLSVRSVLITAPPQSQVAYVGLPVTISVAADASPSLSYQWRFNGNDLPGATAASLVFPSVQLHQAGNYSVVVSNSYGMLTSAVATLDVKLIAGWGRNNFGQTNVPTGLTNVVAIAAADRHNVTLRTDGTVVVWGDNAYGQLNLPAGLANVRAIAAANLNSLALLSDGTVTAWGLSSRTNLPAGLNDVRAISLGGLHALALRADGGVLAWGYNATSGQANVPVDLTNVVAVAAGDLHSLAVRGDGGVVAWGNNGSGQTVVPDSATNIIAVAAGGTHSLALRADGSVVAWGNNSSGQISVPLSATNVIAIAAGYRHSQALRSDGAVISWGLHDGDSGTSLGMITPSWLGNVATVAAGDSHSLALLANGPPFLLGEMVDRLVPVAGTVYFHAPVSGGRELTYQWRFAGTDLPGATNRVLVFTNVQSDRDGFYSVAISNAVGGLVSEPARLSVLPLLITTNPSSRVVTAGGNTTFTVGVSGVGPFTYQWRFNGTNLLDATNSALSLTTLQLNQAGFYSVVVSNAWGGVSSSEAQLTVPAILINAQPQSRAVFAGFSTNLSVAASGAPLLRFQWRLNGTDLPGATSATLTLPNVQISQAGAYTVVITNGYGAVTSQVATLTVRSILMLAASYAGIGSLTNASEVIAFSAGGNHALALRPDRTVFGWGNNTYGQITIPASATNVIAVAAGINHSLALRADGTVIGWGQNNYNQATIPANLSNVVAIAAGETHSLALRANGGVVAWGYSGNGQTSIPFGLTNVVAIDAGAQHSIALCADGTLSAWGNNSQGQTTVPASASNVIAIAAGNFYNLALRSNGTVVAWGQASYSQTIVPAGLSNVVAIAAGSHDSLALRADGTVRGWGYNLGNGTAALGGGSNIVAIAGGNDFSLLLGGSGSPFVLDGLPDRRAFTPGTFYFNATASGQRPLHYQWTHNGFELPGATNGLLSLSSPLPTQTGGYALRVSNLTGVVTSRVAFFETSEVITWGRYYNGSSNALAATTGGLTNIIAVAAGEDHGVALRGNGTVVAWGNNQYGQLSIPMAVQFQTATVAAGGNHSLALLTNGTVRAWGRNSYGQTVVPPGLSNVVALAAGREHSLALKFDGTVVGWGRNFEGQTNVPAGLGAVVGIAAAANYSLAVRADGTVAGWGNSVGTNRPVDLTNVMALAAGLQHVLALRSDGRVTAWGSGAPTNVPAGLSNVVAIAAGEQHSFALRADGRVVAWGGAANVLSQTNVPANLSNVVALASGAEMGLALVGSGKPAVTLPAFHHLNAPGAQVQLQVFAVGAGLHYQWQRDGVNIAGATNRVLPLDGNAYSGVYRVVVSNAFGVTLSRASVVTAIPVFAMTAGTGLTTNGFQLRLVGLSGRNYVILLASTNLSDWTPLHTNLPVFGSLDYLDRTSTNFAQRFYRATESDLALGPLRITSLQPAANGAVQLDVAGLTGLGPVWVWASSNLLDWQPVLTNPPQIGPWRFTEGAGDSHPVRFYRVQEQR